eukprot:CAMPEP_0175971244 /NCGR_PEP_ID=MMETSP0108-20121206/41545_1 /TAXON_ID=195067 ORGANISM="Goniomonas pacifica, Strain CCMP1869" /NCGR_SAMPLE_ID=MMETSP0108 /ASSEMBLY_ACC=CAM_ASM_000204 /LENGTH=52 /DNA_ID=CAMNT_0017300387 /DNA_START=776 /DNA_END=934 /DNA_ORIENTATION=+
MNLPEIYLRESGIGASSSLARIWLSGQATPPASSLQPLCNCGQKEVVSLQLF